MVSKPIVTAVTRHARSNGGVRFSIELSYPGDLKQVKVSSLTCAQVDMCYDRNSCIAVKSVRNYLRSDIFVMANGRFSSTMSTVKNHEEFDYLLNFDIVF